MDLIEKEENFKLPFNDSYSNGGPFRWFETGMEASLILSSLSSYKSIEDYCNVYSYYKDQLKSWSLINLAESTLYFYLEEKIKDKKYYKEPLISFYEWQLITNLIINSSISDQILVFIRDLNLIEISPTQKIIHGSYYSIANITLQDFEEGLCNKKSLKNLLNFLNVDIITTNYIVSKTLDLKDKKLLATFIYTLNKSGDSDFVLTQALNNFTKFISTDEKNLQQSDTLSNKDFYKIEFDKKAKNLIELQFAELESFDIFDLFDSAEIAKSKGSNLLLYSFYNDFYENLTDASESETKELLRLFETFLLSYDNKILLLEKPEIELLIHRFLLEKKEKIDYFLERYNSFFAKFLKEIPLTQILLSVVLIATFISKPFGLYPRTRVPISKVSQAPFGMIGNHAIRVPRPNSFDSPIPTIRPSVETTSLAKKNPASLVMQPKRNGGTNNVLRMGTKTPVQITAKSQSNRKKAIEQKRLAKAKNLAVIEAMKVQEALQARQDQKASSTVISNVNVKSEFVIIDGKETVVDEFNYLNSSMRYGEKNDYKTVFESTLVLNPDGPLKSDRVLIDFEHVHPGPILKGFGMSRNEGASFGFLKRHHQAFTKIMEYRQSPSYGYTSTKLNGIDWVQDTATLYDNQLVNFYQENPDLANELIIYGTDVDKVRAAAKRAFNLDVEHLDNTHVSTESILPVSHIRLGHEQAFNEFNDFVKKTSYAKHDPSTSFRVLKDGMKVVRPIFTHYEAVYKLVDLGTETKAECAFLNDQLKSSINNVIVHVERKTGQNLSEVRDGYFASIDKVSLEEAENIARDPLGLYYVQKGVKPVWLPTTFKAPRQR